MVMYYANCCNAKDIEKDEAAIRILRDALIAYVENGVPCPGNDAFIYDFGRAALMVEKLTDDYELELAKLIEEKKEREES